MPPAGSPGFEISLILRREALDFRRAGFESPAMRAGVHADKPKRVLLRIGVAAVVTEALTIRSAARGPGPRDHGAVAGHIGREGGGRVAGEKLEDGDLVAARAGARIVHDI